MEANNFPNFQKCGEILIDINSKDKNNKIYIFHCTFCNTECDQLKKFSLHIGEEHLNDFETILCEADLKVEAEPEELQLETFTIIENPDNAFESHTGSITNMHSCRVKQELIDNYEDESIIYDKEPVYCTASASGFSNSRAKQKLGSAVESSSKNLMFATDSDELRCNAEQRANKKRRISFDGKDKLLKQMASTNDVSPDESKDGDCNKSIRPLNTTMKLHKQNSSSVLNEILSRLYTIENQVKDVKGTIVEQNKINCSAMAEHNSSIKTLLESFCQKPKYIDMFPIASEEELISWEGMIDESNRDEMVKTVKTLVGEKGITKGLVAIISEKLLLQYNMDGIHNKSRFKNFPKILQVFSVVHSTSALNDNTPNSLDKNMRIAFKNAKNRHFKSNYDKKKRMLEMEMEEAVDDV